MYHGMLNIRVNAVCPGDTDTPMLRSEAVGLGIAYDQFVKDSSKERPLGRIGTPMDTLKLYYSLQAMLPHSLLDQFL
jgi:NAD(P)-dependent dehydrogenase (short-subunit alcohol dehydrogenase family)